MNLLKKWKERRKVVKWHKNGCPPPPPHSIKQQTLREYIRRFNLKVMVETGTHRGDMIAAMLNNLDHLYTIELAQHYFEMAKHRFRKHSKVTLLQGDSGKVLKDLVPTLTEPTLFWLDGHYSAGDTARGDKDSPALQELEHIFANENLRCVILIDDARCFPEEHPDASGYPSLKEVRNLVALRRPSWTVEVACDCIRIAPPQ